MAEKKKEIAFEEAIEKLEKIVATLENGKAPLDESLSAFEEGVALVNICKKQLDEAEQKVKILTEQGGKKDEKDFDYSEK